MAASYKAALGDSARSYLEGRGLSEQAIDWYRLGEVDKSHPEHEGYAGWICIPYLTRAGVVSLKFRNTYEGASPKYITPTSCSSRLYNPLALDEADKTGVLAVTEGEFDAMILHFECMIPAVGIPGVTMYRKHPEWRELFKAYDQVLIFPDNDEPGEGLAKEITRDIDTARVVKLPGQDVNKTFLEYGKQEIRRIAGI